MQLRTFVFVIVVILVGCAFVGCSSNIASEKQAEGLRRPKILEEDITQGPTSPLSNPSSPPVLTPGAEPNPAPLPGIQPSNIPPDPSASGKTPRRFQWKDNR